MRSRSGVYCRGFRCGRHPSSFILMRLSPLGDQAVLAYLSDESAAVRFAAALRAAAPPWLQDVVPAYASVGVFFDADVISLRAVMRWLGEPAVSTAGSQANPAVDTAGSPRQYRVPVCYDLQHDMARVCERTGLTADE